MKRRDAILGLVAACCSGATSGVVAQAPDRLRRIGFVSLRSGPNEYDAAFRESLRAMGYIEGQTVRIDYRWAAGSEQRADALVAELLAARPDVIVAATTPATRAAMRATKVVPIVMAAVADPVTAGLVRTLARPGGNVTGLSMVSPDTAAKRLQLLQELLPSARRIGAFIGGLQEPVNSTLVLQLQQAARQLSVELIVADVRKAADIVTAFDEMQRQRADAIFVQAFATSIDNRSRIAELAATRRLPAVYELVGFVEAGGLLAYGPSIVDMHRRAAVYVDKILKGTRPSDLPIELPTKYELVINLKASKALGLQLPQSLIVRADRVIE